MPDTPPLPKIDINYIKSGSYREASCDGVVGGPTPANKLWVAFYTERLPIPRIVQHQLKAAETDGELEIDSDTPPKLVEGRSGMVRNLEFGLYLTPETAVKLHEWLGRKLKDMTENQP